MSRIQENKFFKRIHGTIIFHYGRLPFLLGELLKCRRYLKKRPIASLNPKLLSRTEVYKYFETQFRFCSSQFLWKHNSFFKQLERGFGEPAFHAAWHHIFGEFAPKKCLEIGVYRGQIISLWSILSNKFGFSCSIYGVTPLLPIGDSVSKYININFRTDIKSNFEYFKLREATIVAQLSSSPSAKEVIRNGNWDLIYIDGSHDYDDVYSDYICALSGLSPDGILALDDSSLFLDEIKGNKAFSGHSGPSLICQELAINELNHILSVGHLNFFQRKSV